PMDQQEQERQLAAVLADTQSPAQATRKAAEATLQRLYGQESFPLLLTAIAADSSSQHQHHPVAIRQAALLVLRTFVLAGWSPNLDEFRGAVLLSDAGKAAVRAALLDLAVAGRVGGGGDADAGARRVQASASYVVGKIASADFPEDWPELLPLLLRVISGSPPEVGEGAGKQDGPDSGDDVQLHGALTVLRDLVDSCSEEQFFRVAREIVEAVFGVATAPARRPALRALAVSVFKGCLDPLEMVLDAHRADVRRFLEQALAAWAPFFLAVLRDPLPPAPAEEEERTDAPAAALHRGAVALKLQVVKTLMKVRAVLPALLTPLGRACAAVTGPEPTCAWCIR
ncbi:hypothetical protein KEM52_002529, partial [Ascosphaera acerosa]